VNAPEIAHPEYGKEQGEAFGQEAKRQLEEWIQDPENRIAVSFPKEGAKGKYGRTLGNLYINDILAQGKLVEKGLAETFFIGDSDSGYRKELMQAEERAREANKGIWTQTKESPYRAWQILTSEAIPMSGGRGIYTKLLPVEKGKELNEYMKKYGVNARQAVEEVNNLIASYKKGDILAAKLVKLAVEHSLATRESKLTTAQLMAYANQLRNIKNDIYKIKKKQQEQLIRSFR